MAEEWIDLDNLALPNSDPEWIDLDALAIPGGGKGKPAPGPSRPKPKPPKLPRQPAVPLSEWMTEAKELGLIMLDTPAAKRRRAPSMKAELKAKGAFKQAQMQQQNALMDARLSAAAKNVPSMRAATPAERAELERIVATDVPGVGAALERGKMKSEAAATNFMAGVTYLADDLLSTSIPWGSINGPLKPLGDWFSGKSARETRVLGAQRYYHDKAPIETIAESARGLVGPVLSTAAAMVITRHPVAAFAVQKVADARGQGVTDPMELAKQAAIGAIEGKIFSKFGKTAPRSAILGAAQTIVEAKLAGHPVRIEDVIEAAVSMGGLHVALGILQPKARPKVKLPTATGPIEVETILDPLDPGIPAAARPLVNANLESFMAESKVKSATGNIGAYDPSSPLISASREAAPAGPLTPIDLREMEQRALQAGRPIALTLDTRDSMERQAQTLKQRLLTMDPSTLEFAELAQRQIELATAVADAVPERILDISSLEGLRQHLLESNLGHPGAVDELLGILQPGAIPQGTEGQPLSEGYTMHLPTEQTKAPVVYVPDELFRAAGWINQGGNSISGLNLRLDDLPYWLRRAEAHLSTREFDQAIQAFDRAWDEAARRGQSSISLVNRAAPGYQQRQTAQHETFHAGQEEALRATATLPPALPETDIAGLHDPEWARTHPLVQMIASSEKGRTISFTDPAAIDRVAMELPAYIAGGQYDFLGITTGQGIDFVIDYLGHLIETRGIEALDTIEKTAILRPGIQEAAALARSFYDPLGQHPQASNVSPAPKAGATQTVGAAAPPRIAGAELGRGAIEPGAVGPRTAASIGGGAVAGGGEGGAEARGGEAPATFAEVERRVPDLAERFRQEVNLKEGRNLNDEELNDEIYNALYGHVGGGSEIETAQYIRELFPIQTERANTFRRKSEEGLTQFWDEAKKKRNEEEKTSAIITEEEYARREAEEMEALRQMPRASMQPVGPESDLTRAIREANLSPTEPPPPTEPPRPQERFDPSEPLYEELVAEPVNRKVADAAGELFNNSGIPFDPTEHYSFQVIDALDRGAITVPRLDAFLESKGVSLPDFLTDLESAISNSGRRLGRWGLAARKFYNLVETDPALREKYGALMTHSRQLLEMSEEALRTQTLWRRSGNVIRSGLLTQLGTAAANFATVAGGRLPFSIITDMLRGLSEATTNQMNDPAPFMERLAKREAQLLRPSLDVLMSIASPAQARRLKGIVKDIEQQVPWVHNKLFAQYSSDVEVIARRTRSTDALQQHADHLRAQALTFIGPTEKAHRASLLKKATLLDTRITEIKKVAAQESTIAHKAMSGAERFYGFFNLPNIVQEFFLRGPYFLGRLEQYAAEGGHDLHTLRQAGRLRELPKEIYEKAINDALDFTFALAPGKETEVGRFTSATIEAIAASGPIGAVILPFPRWFYNYSRFMYQWGPWGGVMPLARKGVSTLPGRESQPLDFDRLAKAAVGTALLGAAFALVNSDEWKGEETFEIKLGKLRLDTRRFQPFASYVAIADTTERIRQGRAVDLKAGKVWETLSGLRARGYAPSATEEAMDAIIQQNEVGDILAGRQLGRAGSDFTSIFFTPFLNFRDAWAQFDATENVRLDKEARLWTGGPVERIPELRTRELPFAQSKTEVGPQKLGEWPALRLLGIQISPERSFAAREWSRLGISPSSFLQTDSDPLINREQNRAFAELLSTIGESYASNPLYRGANDLEKAAQWKQLMIGDTSMGVRGLAEVAREIGEAANPVEAARRQIKRTVPPLKRRAIGLDQQLKEMK